MRFFLLSDKDFDSFILILYKIKDITTTQGIYQKFHVVIGY